MKARRKPLEVESVIWDGSTETYHLLERWTRAIGHAIRLDNRTGVLYISTHEGGVAACPGDYVIRGAEGEVYPIVPRRYKLYYEDIE